MSMSAPASSPVAPASTSPKSRAGQAQGGDGLPVVTWS
jgi:hypothetical protein